MTLLMGRSLAGHDKGHVYVVLREENGYYFLADGTTRTVASPKKKNARHLQLIRHLPEDVAHISEEENDFRDLWIKRSIQIYNGLCNKAKE